MNFQQMAVQPPLTPQHQHPHSQHLQHSQPPPQQQQQQSQGPPPNIMMHPSPANGVPMQQQQQQQAPMQPQPPPSMQQQQQQQQSHLNNPQNSMGMQPNSQQPPPAPHIHGGPPPPHPHHQRPPIMSPHSLQGHPPGGPMQAPPPPPPMHHARPPPHMHPGAMHAPGPMQGPPPPQMHHGPPVPSGHPPPPPPPPHQHPHSHPPHSHGPLPPQPHHTNHMHPQHMQQQQQQQQQPLQPPLAQSHHNHHQPPTFPPRQTTESPYYQSIPQTELRIHELNRRLQQRPLINSQQANSTPLPNHAPGRFDECAWWNKLTSDFFTYDASLVITIPLEDKPMNYRIGRTLIPRFFKSYFDGGVIDLSIRFDCEPREIWYPNSPMIGLHCDRAIIITQNLISGPIAQSKTIVQTLGQLVLEFVNTNSDELKIKSWIFEWQSYRESIDRSLAIKMHNSFLEPITKKGLTKETVFYLRMCMIMEPMQGIMFRHKQTRDDPRTCLKNYLFEKFRFRGEEQAAPPKRQRKKKATTGATAATGSKKAKANQNINNNNNHSSNNNSNSANNIISPALSQQDYSVPQQEIMIVGEPSLMGGEFGDDNERMITRMVNQTNGLEDKS